MSPDHPEIWKMRTSVRGKRKMDYGLCGSSEEEFMDEEVEERDKSEEDILSQVGPFHVPQHHEIIPLSILGCD